MVRFAGIKNNYITVVSDKNFSCDGLQVLEVPSHLSSVSATDLILNYRVRDNKIYCKNSNKLIKDIKVAFVGNWKMACGISTYSENLLGAISHHLSDFKLFIEENSNKTGDITEVGGKSISPDRVVECWKRGESLKTLVNEIKKYDPDIVWIQHEFGLWSNAMYWLSFMTQLSDYRVIVTMHSVFHHKDKTICEAAMPEIVTHLQGGHDILKREKAIPGKVYVIPHGCYPCSSQDKLWNFYKSDKTFLQFGFGFRYKGWENSIKATAILAKKYPDVFFTGLFSESSFSQVEHQIYYNELLNLVESLGIQENVAIIRGFQSEPTLDSYLRTNQVSIFPYISHPDHEVFGASGAARLAMSKGLPVITSSVNHFSDLPTIKADSPEDIANSLELLFNNKQAKDDQIAKQINFINRNTWEKVALQYISIFENSFK